MLKQVVGAAWHGVAWRGVFYFWRAAVWGALHFGFAVHCGTSLLMRTTHYEVLRFNVQLLPYYYGLKYR